jgi:ribosome biogenesis protein Tsr3
MEYCSTVKKKEVMLFEGKWMKLETIMLNKITQAQKRQVSYIFVINGI